MKRVYEQVSVRPEEGGFAVTLDGKPVRTPASGRLVVPWRRLAEAIAEEWRAQDAELKPAEMRLTRLANTALDRIPSRRAAVVEETAGYAATDLLCYRAETPAELAQRQAEAWQPVVDWACERLGVRFVVTSGVIPARQPDAAVDSARAVIEAFNDFTLSAAHVATAACGSVLLALAVAERRLEGEAAWELSQLDETFQMERWGADAEAEARHAGLRAEVLAAASVMAIAHG